MKCGNLLLVPADLGVAIFGGRRKLFPTCSVSCSLDCRARTYTHILLLASPHSTVPSAVSLCFCHHPPSLNPDWPHPAALVPPLPLHGDGLETPWPAKPYCVNISSRLTGVEGDGENLLSVFLGGQMAGAWVGVGGVTFADTAVHEEKRRNEKRERGESREAQLRKTKQGVCWRSRK